MMDVANFTLLDSGFCFSTLVVGLLHNTQLPEISWIPLRLVFKIREHGVRAASTLANLAPLVRQYPS